MIEASLTIAEVAELAQLSVSAIRRATKEGRLRSVKLGRAVRFRAADVRKWLDEGDVCPPKSAPAAKARGTKLHYRAMSSNHKMLRARLNIFVVGVQLGC